MADNGRHPCVWELPPFLMHFFHPSGLFTLSIFLLTRAHSATHRSIHYRRGSRFRSMEIARRGKQRPRCAILVSSLWISVYSYFYDE